MLRGTRARVNKWQNGSQKITLQNQITSLKRQVNRNKAETLYFRYDGQIDGPAGSGNKIHNLIPTHNLITNPHFRTDVTGDRWINKFLKLKFYIEPDVNAFRIVAYIPKKTGNRFTPSRFTAFPDPSAFTILRDKLLTRTETDDIDRIASRQAYTTTINLRNRQSVYNSNNAILEKGELVVMLMSNGSDSTAGTKQYDYAYELIYCNK